MPWSSYIECMQYARPSHTGTPTILRLHLWGVTNQMEGVPPSMTSSSSSGPSFSSSFGCHVDAQRDLGTSQKADFDTHAVEKSHEDMRIEND